MGASEYEHRRLPALAAACLLALASCGGGDAATTVSSSTSTTVGGSTSTTVGPSTTTTVGPSTTATIGSSTTTTVGPSTTTTTVGPSTATTAAPALQTVSFTTAVGDKRWGDPDFPVTAQASSGDNGNVTYTASGGCTVVAGSGVVSIEEVGSCSITARHPGNARWAAAESDPLTFDIGKAQPVITFEDVDVRFNRNLTLDWWASVEPAIPLTFSVVQTLDTYNDANCRAGATQFAFPDNPFPVLSAVCGIEVRAAEKSGNYDAPAPVTALVSVGFPSWNVDIVPVASPVSFSQSGGAVTLTILETSGDVYGMELFFLGQCSIADPDNDGFYFAIPEPTVPRGTTQFTTTVLLEDPAGQADPSCSVTASGFPADHIGGKGSDTVTFAIAP